MKPRLASDPKCYMDYLCVHGTMTVFKWIELAATPGIEGLGLSARRSGEDGGNNTCEGRLIKKPLLSTGRVGAFLLSYRA